MKNILKAWLRKDHLSNDYHAHVVTKGNMGMDDIVDEMINEGLEMNRETVMNVITRFNRKSAELALSGCTVSNGLVNIRSYVRGPLINGKWDPNVNWVDVTLSHGKDLYQVVAETTVTILGEKDIPLESYDLSEQTNQFSGSIQKGHDIGMTGSQPKTAPEPACGIAFRRWLCKA